MDNLRSQAFDGESIITRAGAHIEIVCCDCGLVHDVWNSYDPTKRMTSLMFVRNNERSKEVRKERKKKKKKRKK